MRHGVLAAEYRVGAHRAIAGTLSGCVYPHGHLSLRLSRHAVTHLPGLESGTVDYVFRIMGLYRVNQQPGRHRATSPVAR